MISLPVPLQAPPIFADPADAAELNFIQLVNVGLNFAHG